MAKIKLYNDCDKRVILSFEDVGDIDEFIKKIIRLASETTVLTPVDIPNVEPPEEIEDDTDDVFEVPEEKEPYRDFEEPFAGKSPEEIANAPKFEGLYFLFRALREGKLPDKHKDSCKEILVNRISGKLDTPPLGNAERMVKYVAMGQRLLGTEYVPDEWLTHSGKQLEEDCDLIASLIKSTCDNISKF